MKSERGRGTRTSPGQLARPSPLTDDGPSPPPPPSLPPMVSPLLAQPARPSRHPRKHRTRRDSRLTLATNMLLPLPHQLCPRQVLSLRAPPRRRLSPRARGEGGVELADVVPGFVVGWPGGRPVGRCWGKRCLLGERSGGGELLLLHGGGETGGGWMMVEKERVGEGSAARSRA